MPADLANDNGKPEDHLAAAIVALHKAMEGLDAPSDLLVGALAVEAPVSAAQPQRHGFDGPRSLAPLSPRRDLLNPHLVADLLRHRKGFGLVLGGQHLAPMRQFEHDHDVCCGQLSVTPSPRELSVISIMANITVGGDQGREDLGKPVGRDAGGVGRRMLVRGGPTLQADLRRNCESCQHPDVLRNFEASMLERSTVSEKPN